MHTQTQLAHTHTDTQLARTPTRSHTGEGSPVWVETIPVETGVGSPHGPSTLSESRVHDLPTVDDPPRAVTSHSGPEVYCVSRLWKRFRTP